MGLFGNKELSKEQIEKLHELLPEEFHKTKWYESDLNPKDGIKHKLEYKIMAENSIIKSSKKNLDQLKADQKNIPVNSINIYNIDLYDAEPLGMVDIGIVHKFNTSSSGDRFGNGLIGYAIENALDKTWADNNVQFNAVNEVKFQLLQKAKEIYPSCNLLFKYEVDFREMGSSGNVFIYMRGTAAKGVNKAMENQLLKVKKEIA